ncbi:transglycosylase SLT domain-containing protein [Aquipuribacter nitratireducens]|uniref:Transglycosylase SLT domain-containing protein n=1 Tax=Aquipuribacter nitratireducens TaxID=650104 RepID=A0ABW0GNE9_9MICO
MSVVEVQARIAAISGQLQQLTGRRAAVDPLQADAFAAQLGQAGAALGLSSPAAGGPGQPVTDVAALQRLLGAGGTGGVAAVGGTSPTAGGSADDGRVTGGDVVAAARKYLGVPYKWGGTDPRTGLDCSGLVQRVFKDLGVDVPRTVADQRRAGDAVPSLAQARPGDLIAFSSERSPSGRHIGIYIGDGKMINAPRAGKDVMISDVWAPERITAIRRIVPADAPATAQPAQPAQAAQAAQAAARPGWAATAGGLAEAFTAATARYDLPTGLLEAVARRESGMRSDAVSPAGAIGLMQLMPGTARELGVDPRDPVASIDGAARYLRQQLNAFGTLELALAAYNAGPGNVRRYDGIPPFAETHAYVSAILADLRA